MNIEHSLNRLLTSVFGQHQTGDRRVWFHWQNLNEKRVGDQTVEGSPWRHGRCWFHYVPVDEDHRRSKCLHLEWLFGEPDCRAMVTVDPIDREVLLSGAIPGINLHFGIEGLRIPWLWKRCENGRGYGDPHAIGFYVHDWGFWWSIWRNEHMSSKEDPWWSNGVFHLDNFILGRQQYENVKHGEPKRIWIPLPEGEYLAEAQYETSTWWRPRWPWWPFTIVRQDTKVGVLAWTGLPHEGKGENSWDCGTDGLYGYSSEGHSLSRAIAKGVESTLHSRRRYGGSKPGYYPSPVVDKEVGLKRFAEYAARVTKVHEAHPKWPKVLCHLEEAPLGRFMVMVDRGDNHRSCMVVTAELSTKWQELFAEAMKTVKVEEEEKAEPA